MKKTPLFTLFILLIPIVIGVNFLVGTPTFNANEQVFTNNQLVCEWVLENPPTTSQNITIYRGETIFTNVFETSDFSSSITIPATNTTKNEEWFCEIVVDEDTDNIGLGDTTIQNSAPETPTIYDSSQENIGSSYNVTEGETYTFNVTSSDIDGDTLWYYFKPPTQGFCEIIDPAAGIAQCNPGFEDRVIDGDIQFNNVDIDIVFWVDDDDPIFAKSASRTVTFTLTPINNAPFVQDGIGNQTINVDEEFILDFTITDLEEDHPIDVSFFSIPSEIAPKSSIQSTGPTTARFIYNGSEPDFNDVNEDGWDVLFNITDNRSATTIEGFSLAIENIGRAPNITIEDSSIPLNAQGRYEVLQDEFMQINFSASDEDFNDTHNYGYAMTRPSINILTTDSSADPTANSTATLNFTPTNNDVGNFSIVVSVTDSFNIEDNITINFSVVNVNDPPIIFEESFYDTNRPTFNNVMSNVTAFVAAPFSFRINATDPDLQFGDEITFSDNTSIFDIDSETGFINFTPTASDFQNSPHLINITVTDSEGLQTSRTLNLTIGNNTAPYFDPTPLPSIVCDEGTTCFYNLSQYAFDNDTDDKIAVYEVTSPTITTPVNDTTGIINFTPSKQQVGEHVLEVTIIDTRGAPQSTMLNLTINNTPSAPKLKRANFSDVTIVENFTFSYELQAQDADFLIPASDEELEFSTNLSFVTIDSDSYEQGVGNAQNQTNAILGFEPTSSLVGEHTINITVTDTDGLNDSIVFTFEVLTRSCPPVIEQISPFTNSTGDIEEGFTSISPVSCNSLPPPTQAGNQTLEFSEDNTFTFAHITTDDITPGDELEIRWYYNDELKAETWNYTRYFDFFSSGNHTLRLEVEDERFETTAYEWYLEIEDVPRPPVLVNPLRTPIKINDSINLGTFLSRDPNELNDSLEQKFLNLDDDINNNNKLDGNETDTLIYSLIGACGDPDDPFAEIDVSGSVVSVSPNRIGVCNVTFRAQHPESSALSIESNPVEFNVTIEPEGEEETDLDSTPSGGSSAPSSQQPIPITRETEVPEPLNIISPSVVQITQEETLTIPFSIENTWDEDLSFIRLETESNNTAIETTFSSDLVENLVPEQVVELELEVTGYRLGENYEIELYAHVEEPEFSDSATILLSSIEYGSPGDESFDLRVTFARDLLNENPECQELNQVMDLADQAIEAGDLEEARSLTGDIIDGCRTLMGTTQQSTERPNPIPNMILLNQQTITTLLFGFFTIVFIMTLSFVIYYHYTLREEDDI